MINLTSKIIKPYNETIKKHSNIFFNIPHYLFVIYVFLWTLPNFHPFYYK